MREEPLRIALGGFEHETNTYADRAAGTTPLEAFDVRRDEEIVTFYDATRTFTGGILDGARDLGAALIPTLTAIAQPSGTIRRAAYETLRDELCARIAAAAPLDAVALVLHGAGVAEGVDDVETDLCAAVRAAAGEGAALVAVFDLHGNVTQATADLLDLGFGCHLYPHTDMYERGREALGWLPRLHGGARPFTHVERLPMLLPPSTTNRGPAAAVNELCAEIERRDGIIDCTFFHGFPYVDGPHAASRIWVAADAPDLARAAAREVAAAVWAMREGFRADVLTPAEAVARARALAVSPVVINETCDNAGGGAPADGTHLLRAMLDARLEDACFGYICDPDVAAAAHAAGPGATMDVALGGKTDDLHGAPLRARAIVEGVNDGRYTLRTWAPGLAMDHGPMARLRIDGIDVLVGSKRSQTFEPALFELHGIDVTRRRIVALKSSHHFRAAFEPLAAAIVTSDGGGLTTMRPEVFPRARTPRPIWPLDADARYP